MNRSLTAMGAVVLAGGLLVACSQQSDNKDPSKSAGSETSGGAQSGGSSGSRSSTGYDIDKIVDVKDQFPPGFTVRVVPRVTLDQTMVDQLQLGPSSLVTFDPPECGNQMSSMTQTVGSSMATLSGSQQSGAATAARSGMTVVSLESVNPIPADPGQGQCDKFSVTGPGGVLGTGEKIDPPTIDGVETRAYSSTLKIDGGAGGDLDLGHTTYIGKLDDTHAVVVTATGNVDRNQARDLFVKAVNAVKG